MPYNPFVKRRAVMLVGIALLIVLALVVFTSPDFAALHTQVSDPERYDDMRSALVRNLPLASLSVFDDSR